MLNLKQIRYYCGEESAHIKGKGLAPTEIFFSCKTIRERFKRFKISENLYKINGNIIELSSENQIGYFPHQEGYGNLCFRIIGNSKKDLEKITGRLKIDYDEKLIVPLLSREINFRYLHHYPISLSSIIS